MLPRASGRSNTSAALASVRSGLPTRSPRGPYAALIPVSVAWTIGRPFSAARSAPSEACWAGAQLCWNVEVADWATMTCAPSRTSLRLMSGNAVSKQTSGPIRSPRAPSGRVITTWRSPRSRSSPAALPTDVAHPSRERAGTYSPNGTRRILS